MTAEIIREIFRSPPELRTPRLRMRKLCKKDAEDMFEYASCEAVTKYLTWEAHDSLAYTKKYLSYIGSRYRAGEFYDWALVLADSDKMIGTCGFTTLDPNNNSAELGYVIAPRFWGMGFAPEAASEVMAFGFEQLAIHRLEARYMLGNARSKRVMEKLGMTFEGEHRDAMYIKNRYVGYGVYAILAEDYFKRAERGRSQY